MSTPDTPDFGNAEVNAIARLLANRGFQLSRGTYYPLNGDPVRSLSITRPDTPEWSGNWDAWKDGDEPDAEAICALLLAADAMERWSNE